MGTLWKDLRYAARMLWKNPGFTAVAVLAVALGVGADTTIFSCGNALLLHPLPFQTTDRAGMVWEKSADNTWQRGSGARPNQPLVADAPESFAENTPLP